MCDWQQEAISADLIVLNRGMRYRQTPLFEEEMKQLIRELALARRSTHRNPLRGVVYRSTHFPMHAPLCHKMPDPFQSPSGGQQRNLSVALSSVTMQYDAEWKAFPAQNKIAHRLFREAGAHFLDVYEMSRERPGGRMGDCIHYCLPGPPDDWNLMLFAAVPIVGA